MKKKEESNERGKMMNSKTPHKEKGKRKGKRDVEPVTNAIERIAENANFAEICRSTKGLTS